MTTPNIVNVSPDADSHAPAAIAEHLAQPLGGITDSGLVSSTPNAFKALFHQKVPENPLADFMSRYVKLFDITIQDTDTPLLNFMAFDPWQAWLGQSPVQDKVKNFSLIRGTMEVVGVIAVPGNAFGSYVFAALPNGGSADPGTLEIGADLLPENCCQVDRYTRLDCAASENVAFQLPFLWPFDFAELPVGPQNMWKIYGTCLSPLQTAIPGGVTTGHITWYARMLDFEMTVPKLQGRSSQHLVPNEHLAKAAPEANARAKGRISSMANSAQSVADALTGVPVIGAYAAAASKVAGTISSIASMFGFTREAAPHPPTVVSHRSVTNVGQIDGDDSSEVAALSIANAISVDPMIGGISGSVDCLATSDLMMRWTHVKQFTWTPAQASGTNLASVPVSPSYLSDSSIYPGPLVMTTAGWFGLPFNYWRGDMEFMVIIPVSKLHRGSIQAFWVPFGSTASEDPTMVALNEISSVTCGENKIYTIGYARAQPFVQNVFLSSQAIVNTNYTNGFLVLRVVNPLQSQNPDNVVIGHIFARAGANMEFAVPRDILRFPTPTDPFEASLNNFRYQGASGDEDDCSPERVQLVASSGDFPADKLFFGERISSVRALLQKPTLIFPHFIGTGAPTAVFLPPLGNLPISSGLGFEYLNSWTFAGWYRAAFTGFACSERIKVVAGNDNAYIGIGPRNISDGNTVSQLNHIPLTAPVSYKGETRGNEALVPYYTPRKFVLSRYNFGQLSVEKMLRGTQITVLGSANQVVDMGAVYHSFGPDIRVTGFRQIPGMKIDLDVVNQNVLFG